MSKIVPALLFNIESNSEAYVFFLICFCLNENVTYIQKSNKPGLFALLGILTIILDITFLKIFAKKMVKQYYAAVIL